MPPRSGGAARRRRARRIAPAAKRSAPPARLETRLVLAAFEPFGGRPVNRALQVARLAARRTGHAVHVLPVRFDRLGQAVGALLRPAPEFLLILGEHHRAAHLHVERLARNRIEPRVPDNAGRRPRRPVRPGGPATLRSTLPLRRILAVLARHAPARLSDDAGRFACNAALYRALDLGRRKRLATRSGFVHVPLRGIPLRDAGRAVAALIATLTRTS